MMDEDWKKILNSEPLNRELRLFWADWLEETGREREAMAVREFIGEKRSPVKPVYADCKYQRKEGIWYRIESYAGSYRQPSKEYVQQAWMISDEWIDDGRDPDYRGWKDLEIFEGKIEWSPTGNGFCFIEYPSVADAEFALAKCWRLKCERNN